MEHELAFCVMPVGTLTAPGRHCTPMVAAMLMVFEKQKEKKIICEFVSCKGPEGTVHLVNQLGAEHLRRLKIEDC